MDVLVTYDVSTETRDGRRRLRRVAKTCLDYGQRVQQSVFECRVTRSQYEALLDDLEGEIDEEEDSLRVYRLAQPRDDTVEIRGLDARVDPDEPLIL